MTKQQNGSPWEVPDYAVPPRRDETPEPGPEAVETVRTFVRDPQQIVDILTSDMRQDVVNLIAWRAAALQAQEQAQARRARKPGTMRALNAMSAPVRAEEKNQERQRILRGCAVYPILLLWMVVCAILVWRTEWWPVVVVVIVLQLGWLVWSLKAPARQRPTR